MIKNALKIHICCSWAGHNDYLNRGKFRAIRRMPDYGTEKSIVIAKYPNVQQAWLRALNAIKDYKP